MAYSRLRRTSDQRKALLRDLVTDIIIHESITTTEAKAKELKKLADEMITLAKDGSVRRKAAEKVRFEEVKEGQMFKNYLMKLDQLCRKGGYTVRQTVPRRRCGANGNYRIRIKLIITKT